MLIFDRDDVILDDSPKTGYILGLSLLL